MRSRKGGSPPRRNVNAAPLSALILLGFALKACTSGPHPRSPGSEGLASDRRQPVRFRSGDGFELVGTLRLPPGAGPFPGVVLIHGSGPQSRDGSISGQLGMNFGFRIAVLRELSEALAQKGYAALSYDKRTCGPFNGCASNRYPRPGEGLSLETLLDDAIAAGDALGEHPSVQPDKIAFIGHSQGGTLVPFALQARPRWRAGVLLGVPHRPVDKVLFAQGDTLADLVEATGAPRPMETPIHKMARDVRELRDARGGGRAGDRDRDLAGASSFFWRSWLDFSDRAPRLLRDLGRPQLVVIGRMDLNVPSDAVERWRATLAPVPDAEVVQLDGLTHALNTVDETNVEKIRTRHLGRAVSPTVVDEIDRFLSRVFDEA